MAGVSDRMMGQETEYAVTAFTRSGEVVSHGAVATGLLRAANRAFATGSDDATRAGLFLGNGARMYVDMGAKTEVCSPECTGPVEVVRYVRAGERMMQRAADAVSERQDWQVHVFRHNVDYAVPGSTWGFHESYMVRCDIGSEILRDNLTPHLISRLVYSGAGGWLPRHPGLVFSLSPRLATHFSRTQSSDSTHNRGIFHTRDESLCTGWRRVHVIAGDSLCSDKALLLKLGATAVVLRLIELGVNPGLAVMPKRPVQSMRTFAGDPEGRVTTRLGSGQRASALDIQRHYLRTAERYASRLPAWARETVLPLWRECLDSLASRDPALSLQLDWAIKQSLFVDHCYRRGFDECRLARWNGLVDAIFKAARQTDEEDVRQPGLPTLAEPGWLRRGVEKLGADATAAGFTWEGLEDFFRLRDELCELDMRFGQLTTGIFAQLDAAGVLDHRVAEVDDLSIQRAITTPPERGRARVRGLAIQRLTKGRTRFHCYWDRVIDQDEGKVLDLSDPFAESEQWQPMSIERCQDERDLLRVLESILRQEEEQTRQQASR